MGGKPGLDIVALGYKPVAAATELARRRTQGKQACLGPLKCLRIKHQTARSRIDGTTRFGHLDDRPLERCHGSIELALCRRLGATKPPKGKVQPTLNAPMPHQRIHRLGDIR